MILDERLTQSREFKFFLYCRKRIRDVHHTSQILTRDMRLYFHQAAVLTHSGSPFDANRIRHLEETGNAMRVGLRKWEAQNDEYAFEFFNALELISEQTSPLEKASILGNTENWLDSMDKNWREMDMLDLIFAIMCENEHKADYELPPLFWYSARLITRLGKNNFNDKLVQSLMEDPQEKGSSQESKKPHLYLVKK